jgi:excisionase family DNA binding protein
MDKEAFTIPETVQASGLGRTTIYSDIRAGHLRAVKRGRRTLILAADLKRYLLNLPVARKPEAADARAS